MNFREKLVVQLVICMMIFAGVRSVGMLDVKPVRQVKAFIGEHFQKNYTAAEIKEAGSELLQEAGNLHTTVTSAVLRANQPDEGNEALGKADEEGLQAVYAPKGGTVTEAGICEELGTFIKIKTDRSTEVYGNLLEISVLTGDKVRKGDVIGTFDSRGGKEFICQTA